MEPRPTNKPNRGAGNTPPDSSFPASSNPIYSSGDSASWATSAWTSPNPPPAPKPGANPPEQLTARAADWRGQPGAYAPQNDIGYSPGPSLAPLDGRRGSGWLGPLIAIAVLALIITAVAIAFTKIRGGGGNNHVPTTVAQIAPAAKTKTAEAAAKVKITATVNPAGSSTAAATAAPAKTPTSKPQATDTPASSSSGNSSSAGVASGASPKEFLPPASDFSSAYVMTENASRASAEVAASFSDPAQAAANLKKWLWRQNVYRTYEIPAADTTAADTDTTYYNVSAHRFGTIDGAKSAFTYFSNEVVTTQGLTEVKVDKIGDQTIELTGSSNGANNVVIYIRTGNYLIRLGASSPAGDPAADLIALAKKLVK